MNHERKVSPIYFNLAVHLRDAFKKYLTNYTVKKIYSKFIVRVLEVFMHNIKSHV